LLAWLVRGTHTAALKSAAPFLALGGVAVVVAVCIIDGDTWWWEPTMQTVGYSAIALTGSGMLLTAVTRPSEHLWPRLLSAGWLRAFGKYSYCLYLIHLPVMRMVRAWVLGPAEFTMLGTPWAGQVIFYVLATAPALAIAWVSWRTFESPILRFKSLFPYYPPSAPTVWHDRPRVKS
jgi:peptidoglycan/LPS O-acetylase OafA/YrhL